jgi:putative ABC transport system permease protein
MIRNYIKIAWRNLWNNKVFSITNIFGLALGLACSLLILLWVQSELSMDASNANTDKLYTLYRRVYADHQVRADYNTPGVLSAQIKKDLPDDVQYATSMAWSDWKTFQVGDKIIKVEGTFASDDYFKTFSYPLLQGTAATALNTPASIAISKSMAASFFGSPQAAIGKSIRYENKRDFTITAVFDDLPKTSSRQFKFLINWYQFLSENSWAKTWDSNGPTTFIMLNKNTNAAAFDKKLTHYLDNYDTDQKKGVFTEELTMQRFDEGYLHGNFENGKISGGRIEYVHMFSIVAVFILLIACINFMNLTTARSVKRAKEIGVRKVIGAVRSVLIKQFIGESLILTSIAVIVSLVLVTLLLPFFNAITQKQIDLPFNQPVFWLKLILITIITGIVSGLYPALFLSSFKPVKVLKGAIKLGSGATFFRKGLVVFQFVLSGVLIISTIIISRQINFIQNQNLGYDRDNLIYLRLEGNLGPQYNIFKNEALKAGGITSITRSDNSPTSIENSTGGVDWDGKDPNINIAFTQTDVGYDFVKTMKLKLLQGRDFSRDFATDTAGFIINESALKRIGYKDPIGKRLTFWGQKGTIIGVLKDFHYASLHDPILPIVIRLGENDNTGFALIRAQPGQTRQAIASLAAITQQLNPNFQFNYNFSDDEFKKLYSDEQVISQLSNSFAFLAILISCLGLFGLSIFTASQRVKEIGIRKVLGAGIGSLFMLLSSEFLALVFIAFIIASPLAWYAMSNWLQKYAYRTQIEWWIFLVAGIVSIVVTVITISFQTLKAALTNPVKSLRSE